MFIYAILFTEQTSRRMTFGFVKITVMHDDRLSGKVCHDRCVIFLNDLSRVLPL